MIIVSINNKKSRVKFQRKKQKEKDKTITKEERLELEEASRYY